MNPDANESPIRSYEYTAQTPGERSVSGTLEAASAEAAGEALREMNLRVMHLAPAQGTRARRMGPIGAADFAAFNQQLAQLVSAGLPVEGGLRLIARDMHSKRLAGAVNAVATDLEKGIDLQQAFDAHKSEFPPLYGRLVAAGAASGNLSAMLLNLSRHMELLRKLRGALWRTFAYPAMILAGALVVLTFLGVRVAPQFATLIGNMRIELPWLTRCMLAVGAAMPVVCIVIVSIAVIVGVVAGVLGRRGKAQSFFESIAIRVPLLRGVLRRSMAARWCDAAAIALNAGMDLPAAMATAADTIGSVAIVRDTQRLADALLRGVPADSDGTMQILPETVHAAIAMASASGDLPAVLANLALMYQQQAEIRIASIQAVLGPMLFILLGGIFATLIYGLFAPLLLIIRYFAGGGS